MVRSINIVCNTNDRLEPLKDLLKWMNTKGLGAYSSGCFVVDSSITVRPRNKEEQTFQLIQDYSKRMGHMYVCYWIEL